MGRGVKLNKKSKRQTLSKKYKVEKKVKTHHRKLRREKKRHPEKFRKFKDPGVPNSLPFKAELVAEAKENMAREMLHNQKVQKELKMRKKDEKGKTINMGQKIGDFISEAQKKTAEYEEKLAGVNGEITGVLHDKSAKAYYREFRKVVDTADVVLEVLDARDPLGTRCLPMEDLIVTQACKKLVFVLNKADLVPKENLELWLKYLRREKPTIAFKASTQNQSSNLSHSKTSISKSDLATHSTSKCIGADVLMQLLKNYCRNEGIKTAISVGVVGLPNVGKSSIINSLKRSRACNVGSTPGVTKNLQAIQLDSKIRLLDCPGVILPGLNVNDATSCLRNAVKVESIEDYFSPVDAIVTKAGKEQLQLHYTLPAFKDTSEFLSLMAKKTGKLTKGGVSDNRAAARRVLQDWNSGRIKYYTQPPQVKESETNSAIVSKLSEAFSLESLEEQENLFMEELPKHRSSDLVCIQSLGPVTTMEDGESEGHPSIMEDEENSDDGDSEMDTNEEVQVPENGTMLSSSVQVDAPAPRKPTVLPPKKKERWETTRPQVDLSTLNLRKLQKKVSKKNRKEQKRNLRKTDDLVDALKQL